MHRKQYPNHTRLSSTNPLCSEYKTNSYLPIVSDNNDDTRVIFHLRLGIIKLNVEIKGHCSNKNTKEDILAKIHNIKVEKARF